MSSKVSQNRSEPLVLQVNPLDLILHGGAATVVTHLPRDEPSFSEQQPAPEVRKPQEEFALVNILAKLVEAMKYVDPSKPEGIALRAMARNFVTPQTANALANGDEPIPPQQMQEFQTQEFQQAMHALNRKYRKDPPRRDAVMCTMAAAQGRKLTGNEVYHVFQNLTEGMQLTPEEWQQIIQMLVDAAKLIKKDAEKCDKIMQADPTMFNLAKGVQEGTDVAPDGAIASRGGTPQAQKPDETMGLIETYRDLWMALLKAGQERKLEDDVQRQIAKLLRHVGAKYVRSGRSGMESAEMLDVKASKQLIRKVKSEPAIQADRAKMAALEKLEMAETRGRPLSPLDLLEIFDALGKSVPLTPEMLRAILEYMIAQTKSMKQRLKELAETQRLIDGGGPISPAEAVRVINKAHVQPAETMAILELLTNFFLTMKATKQNPKLRDNCQRIMAQTLEDAALLYAPKKETADACMQVDINTYRTMLMKLRAEQQVKADPGKARAVEELIAAQATGKSPSPQQLYEIFRDLGRGVELKPEMLRIILEYMCNQIETLSPHEKAKVQKQLKHNPIVSPTDVADEVARMRAEEAELHQPGQFVGCFQILPENHPAMAHRPLPPTTQSRERGMRPGPASIDWHRYQPLGIQPPQMEMARILLVQSQLTNAANFDDERTQKTLMQEASDVSFRSILQPSVMEKYQESLKSDRAALSMLRNMSRVGAMDDEQLGKRVDQLLTTLYVNEQQLRGVLQQLVRDRLMANNEAKEIERQCEGKMAEGGGQMKLSDLQTLLRHKQH